MSGISPSPVSPTPSPAGNNGQPPSLYILEKILKWLFFNILISLVPLIYTVFRSCLFDGCNNVAYLISKDGEFLLLSTAILAESIGELTKTNSDRIIRIFSLILIGVSVLFVLLNTNFFMDLVNIKEQPNLIKEQPNLIKEQANLIKGAVVGWSLSMYLGSLIIGIISKILGRD